MIKTPLNLAMLGDPDAQQFCEMLSLAETFAPLTDGGCGPTGVVLDIDSVCVTFPTCVDIVAATGIEVNIGGAGWEAVASVSGGSDRVWEFETTTEIAEGDVVLWQYLGAEDSIVDCTEAADVGALDPVTVRNPLELTAPTLVSAEVGTVDSSTFVLVFSEGLASADFSVGWSIEADATPLTITGATEGTAGTVTITVEEDVTVGQDVTISYDDEIGDIADITGYPSANVLASITDEAVTNNVSGGDVTLVSIAITPDAQTIDYGSTHQFTATGTYSDASTADITGTVTWDSSDDGLATITAGGLATGTGVGTATISATLGAVSADTTLGVIWYPAMLFANSEKGIVVEPFTLSTLYQDAAATTPVTAADDPVGYMGDQSGNNYHATQTVLGDRPAYAIDGNGKPHLRYDATDVLRFNLAAYGSTAPLSMYAVAAANTLADYCMVHSSNSMSETVQIGIGNPRGGVVRNTVAGGTAGTSGVLLAVGTVNIGLNTPTLLGHCFNGAALQAGSSGIWEKATIGAGTFADGAVSAAIGDGTTSTALNSYINYYGGVVIRRVLTAEEQNLLGAYFAGKTGCAYSSDKYAIAVGDSTIADYLGETSILGLLTSAHTEITLAVPGHTIDQQKAVFTASPKSAKMAWVVIQIGLNDLNPVEAASLAIARIQLLVNNAVLASGDPGRVFVAKMNPCKARLITLYGAIDGLVAYQKWLDINEAIMNGGATPITGVGGRISAHEPLLNDGSGNLAAAYDTGDGIHPNDAGRQIVADAWAAAIVAAGYTL